MVNEDPMRGGAVEDLTMAVFTLARVVRSLGQRDVVRVEGLRRSDVPLLRHLAEHGPCRPGALAEHLAVGPSVISRQLVPLVADGLVTRRTDPADARADLVDITALGREQMGALWQALVDYLSARVVAWEESDLTTLVNLLDEFNHSMSPCTAGNELEGTR